MAWSLLEKGNSSGGGGGQTPSLQQVVSVGDTTNIPISFTDNLGVQRGVVGQDEFFGFTLAGRDESGELGPTTVGASTLLLASQQLASVFNGAVNGDFLRLTTKTDINGQDAFVFGSTPLDVIEYDETEIKQVDQVVSTSNTVVIERVSSNVYRADTSQAITSFKLANSSNSVVTVEYYITVNNAPPTPDDLQLINVPRQQSGTDGVEIISFDDTSQTQVNIGDTVQVFAKTLAGSVTVKGTEFDTTLTLIQNAAIQNVGQSVDDLSTDSALDASSYYIVSDGTNFDLPSAASKYSQSSPFGLFVKNDSPVDIFINPNGSDTIDAYDKLGLCAGDSVLLVCTSTSKYSILATHKRTAENVVVVNNILDLPAVTEVSPGVFRHVLEPNKNYLFGNSVEVFNPIQANDSNTIYSEGLFQVTLSYIGSDALIYVDDSPLHLRNIYIDCPNALVISANGTGAITEVIYSQNTRVLSCRKFIEASNVASVVIDLGGVLSSSDTCIDVTGNIGIVSINKFIILLDAPASSGKACVDITGSTITTPEITDAVCVYQDGNFAIAGDANSANVPSGSNGVIRDCSFENPNTPPLLGIGPSDIRWSMKDNTPNVPNSVTEASCYLANSETITIAQSDTWYPTGLTSFTTNADERFSVSNAGVVTYIGERPIRGEIKSIASITNVGGGSDVYEMRMAVNFVQQGQGIDNGLASSRQVTENNDPTSLTSADLVTLNTGDTFQPIFNNTSDSSDIDCRSLRTSFIASA